MPPTDDGAAPPARTVTYDMTGSVALVTGGSRGIGRAIAGAIVTAGGRVVITGRDEAALKAAVSELGTEVAFGVAGDAADEEHRAASVAAVIDRFGRLDLLVNNVGIAEQHGSLAEVDLAAFRRTTEANLIAPLDWARLAWRAGMAEHGGAIVNISSLSGLIVFRDQNAYTVTKAALLQLTRQLALDFAPAVRVNAIAPAVVRTEAGREHWENNEEALARSYPLGRIGEVTDIAHAALFLLSDAASWITGETLLVDGGHLLHR